MKKLLSFLFIALLVLSMFAFFIPQTHAQVVGSGSIDQGLVGYWRFDEGTGTTAADSSGNGNTGTLTNTPSWVAGKYGDALSMLNPIVNGASYPEYVSSTSTNFPTGAGARSISAWIYITGYQSDVEVIATYGGISAHYACALAISSSGHLYFWGSSNDVTSSLQVPLNQWVFVGYTYNGGTSIVFYMNANTNTQSIGYTINSQASSTCYIGRRGDLNYCFNGTIDDVRVYNRALSSAEISTLYTGFPVTVTYDVGSTVIPNGTFDVGVDQSQTFTIGAVMNFIPESIYLDGSPQVSQPSWALSDVQANHTLYVTSQIPSGFAPSFLIIGAGILIVLPFVAIMITRRRK